MKKEISESDIIVALDVISEALLGNDNIYIVGCKDDELDKEQKEMEKAIQKIAKRLHSFIDVGHFNHIKQKDYKIKKSSKNE